MALKMLMATIGGKGSGIVTVDASADDLDALKTLMEGKIEQYEAKATGGTAAPMPAHMRRFKFYVNDGTRNGYKGSFTIPHLKASKSNIDVESFCVGVFDAAYDVTTKADKCGTLLANGQA